MGKIFYLMGKSSSGKDTIYRELLKKEALNLKSIVLYTTRPIRAGEKEGMHYRFVKEEDLEKLIKSGKVIELREYNTFYGIWKYFTVDDGQIDLECGDYLIIGTIESYIKTREYFGADRVLPLMIELDDGIRLQRALDREKNQPVPRYEEMCRRFLADAKDFSEEKKRAAGIEREFVNQELSECLSELESYICERKESK